MVWTAAAASGTAAAADSHCAVAVAVSAALVVLGRGMWVIVLLHSLLESLLPLQAALGRPVAASRYPNESNQKRTNQPASL